MTSAPSPAAARALVAGLAAVGVVDACISPGSRSAPLTAALARHPGIRPWLQLDERSAGFFALGLARATGKPAVLVCTSGTAAANYLPAVVEANLSRVPLIVCTADRPPRLRDVGADQTIPQAGIYGPNVRWELDLPVPVGAEGEERHLAAVALRAVRTALGPLPGPVHLNCPFDEPLIDAGGGGPAVRGILPAAPGSPRPTGADVEAAAALLRRSSRPLVVCGPETSGLPAPEIARLAAALGAPILADPLSGLRTGPHDRSRVLDAYDAVLRAPGPGGPEPDAVVHFGGTPISKPLNLYLAGLREAVHVRCDAWLSWRDPSLLSSTVVAGDPGAGAEALASALEGAGADPSWCEGWVGRDRAARSALAAAEASFAEPFEGSVFTALQAAVPAGSVVFVGNSMPVRDADSFVVSDPKPLAFAANRGAAGIDGVVSTALGMAAARVAPVYLVVGDLSFYHDLNGLWAAARHRLDLTVVLVNNDGGGIFHYLPQAAHEDIFEAWFGTPSALDFAPAVRMYGGEHALVDSRAGLRCALAAAPSGLRVFEVRTDRARNLELHRLAWATVAARLRDEGRDGAA